MRTEIGRIVMKLREKWDKQNNSIKLLLKKLRRHDTRVVAASVVIALILCGGLIYISTPVVAANAKEEFKESERENNENTTKKLDELHDYLTQIDEVITDNNEGIKSFSEKADNDKDANDEYKNVVNEKAGALSGNLTGIHDSITNTKSSIENLKEMMESGNKADKEKAASEFAKINSELEKLKADYADARNKNAELMEDLENAVKSGNDTNSKESNTRYEDLLARLSNLDSEMDKRNSDVMSLSDKKFAEINASLENYFNSYDAKFSADISGVKESVNSDITGMKESVNSDISSMKESVNSDISSMKESMNSDFTGMRESVSSDITGMRESVNVDINGLKQHIDTNVKTVNDKLDQVFGRVSNGKKLLASALLTKGVKVDEDATFEQISKAIQNIPVKMVLDSGETAAEIQYEYHYHKNGKGAKTSAAIVSAAEKGGCYTSPVYHKHTDGCYEYVDEYIISTDMSVVNRGFVKNDSGGDAVNRYRCNHCGKEFTGTSGKHRETVYSWDEVKKRDGKVEEISRKQVLKCNKQDGQLEGYAVGCGFVHGQVAAAHLKFNGKNSKYNTSVTAVNTSNMMRTSSVLNLNSKLLVAAPFDFDLPDEPEEAEVKENPEAAALGTSDNVSQKTSDVEASEESAKISESTAKEISNAETEMTQPALESSAGAEGNSDAGCGKGSCEADSCKESGEADSGKESAEDAAKKDENAEEKDKESGDDNETCEGSLEGDAEGVKATE